MGQLHKIAPLAFRGEPVVPEVVTCTCGEQGSWKLYGRRAECLECGKEFKMVFAVDPTEGQVFVDVAETNKRIKKGWQ